MTKADDSGKPNEQPEQDDSDTIEFELDGRLEQTDDGSGASRLHGTIKTKKRKRNKNAERQARFDDNKKAQGLKRIYVYVHPDVAAEVRAFAKQANNRLLGIAE